MKTPRFCAFIAVFSAFQLAAEAATTDPVGAMIIDIAAGSDGIISAPLARPAVFVGTISSILDGESFEATPGTPWTVDEFANLHYVLVTSGDMEGAFATVAANGTETISLAYVAESFNLGSPGGVQAGDSFSIVPYWTLGSLLQEGDIPVGSQVLLFDRSSAGINNSASDIYQMYAGFGWYSGPAEGNDLVIYPDESFVLRAPSGNPVSVVLSGVVNTSDFRLLLSLNDPALDQDIRLTSTLPVPTPIGAIFNSGIVADGDQILIFDHEATGINNSAAEIAQYYDGFGWYSGPDDYNSYLLQPGQGFIYRKSRNNETEVIAVAPSPLQ